MFLSEPSNLIGSRMFPLLFASTSIIERSSRYLQWSSEEGRTCLLRFTIIFQFLLLIQRKCWFHHSRQNFSCHTLLNFFSTFQAWTASYNFVHIKINHMVNYSEISSKTNRVRKNQVFLYVDQAGVNHSLW